MSNQTLDWSGFAGKRCGIAGFEPGQASAIRSTLESTDAFCRIMPSVIDEAALLSFDVVVINIDDQSTRNLLAERATPQKPPFLMMGSAGTVVEALPLLHKTSADFLFTSSWTADDLLARTLRLTWKMGQPESPSGSTAQPKVLILDDDSSVISLLNNVLKKAGFECHSARDGATGLDMARQLRPDLIIIDINMPNRDGFEVLKMLRQSPETASVRIILLTGCEQEADVLRGFGLGTDDYVTKPFNPMELAARAKSLLGRPR